jgi:Ca-activated chloride channel family protein
MTFGAPERLWLLAMLPLLLALFVSNERRGRQRLDRIVASRLRAALAGSVSNVKRRVRFFLVLAGIACVIVALAKPQHGYTWEQAKRKGRDVIIAIDTSKSMLATDLAPNRLTRAKLAAQDLIQQLQGDRIGVVAFAGTAFLQAPLTIDYSAALSSINELDTDIIPRGGTNIAQVIKTAADAFGKGESENRCLVLFTDGEELERDGVDAARKNAGNFRIFTVGAGSMEGSIIPITDAKSGTTFVKDPEGNIVKSRLDEERLRQIAEVTGGFYTRLQNGPADMKRIVEQGFGKMKERDIDSRTARKPIERYQWPLAAGLILLASSMLISERRRGVRFAQQLAMVSLACIAWIPNRAHAVNNGVELFQKKDYQRSYEVFKKQLERNPKSDALAFNAGAAAYKLGEYERSLESFSRALTTEDADLRAKAEYNLANTLYQHGAKQNEKEPKLKNWRNALQHYDEALKIDSKNGDAKFNRELVRKMIEELEKEPPKQQQQKQDQKEDKKKDEQKDEKQKSDNSKQQQQQQKDQDKKQDEKEKQSQEQNQNSQQQQQKSQSDEKKKDDSEQKQNESSKSQGEKPQEQKKDEHRKSDQEQQKDKESQSPQQQQQQPAGNDSSSQKPQSTQPKPTPDQEQKKLSGDIKTQPQNESPGEQREAEVAAEAGEMTPKQAMNLLESLKGEDEKVPLVERKAAAPVLKDW